jgi:DNA-binding NtrC family response regulator
MTTPPDHDDDDPVPRAEPEGDLGPLTEPITFSSDFGAEEGSLGPMPGVLELVTLGPDALEAVYPLPAAGEISIGRGGTTDVDLADVRISRQHARLHVVAGSRLEIEDLGSANGTRVGRRAVSPRERVPLTVGESVFIGSTVAFVRMAQGERRAREPASMGRFLASLEEACKQSVEQETAFAVVLVELLDGSVSDSVVQVATENLLSNEVFAALGSCQYATLLWSGEAATFSALIRRLGPAIACGEARFPVDGRTPDELLAAARARLEEACLAIEPDEQVVFCDQRMQRLFRIAHHAAVGLVDVLILGPPGVGKQRMARTIHRQSPRADRPMQVVDCASLGEAPAEITLFGEERASLTGRKNQTGMIEAADGGTLLVREIGALTPKLQAKLLHVFETRQSTRVGGAKARPVDVRLIASSSRDLEEEVARGHFRKDLYLRLTGFSITLPPLRDRWADVRPLARAMVRLGCRRQRRNAVPGLSEAAVARLESHPWPGNVGELREVCERAVYLCEGPRIEPEHLSFGDESLARTAPAVREINAPSRPLEEIPTIPVAVSPDASEKRRIEEALAACGGNQGLAAKRLGIARSTLVLRLDTLGIARPRKGFGVKDPRPR